MGKGTPNFERKIDGKKQKNELQGNEYGKKRAEHQASNCRKGNRRRI